MEGQEKKSKIGWYLLGFVIIIGFVMLVLYIRNKKFLATAVVPVNPLSTSPVKTAANIISDNGSVVVATPIASQVAPLTTPVSATPVTSNPILSTPAVQPASAQPIASPVVSSIPVKTVTSATVQTSSVPVIIKAPTGKG